MKTSLFALLALTLPLSAFAIPGNYSIRCKSPEKAEKAVFLSIGRFEVNTDDFPAALEVSIDGNTFKATDENSVASKIFVVRALADKVITIHYQQTVNGKMAELTLWAKPESFKLIEGDPVYNGNYSFTAGYWLWIGDIHEDDSANGLLECVFSQSMGS